MAAIKPEIGHLPINALISALMNAQNSLPKLKLIEVATSSDNYFESTPNDVEFETMLKLLIDLDSDSDPAIRVGIHSTTGSTKFSASELSEKQLLRSCIGKTADGKPYLRIALQSL